MIYFVVIFLLFVYSILDEILIIKELDRRFLFFCAFSTVLLLTGFRGNVEPDYTHYLNIFNNSGWSKYFTNDSVEVGYYFYNVLIKYLEFNFQFVIFSMALVTIFLKFKFFKEQSPRYLISFLLYYCSLFFLYDFIAIRQALAMSIFMFAIPYIVEKKMIKYFICIAIACLFHMSALILLPIYFLIRFKYNNFLVLIVLLLCLGLNVANFSFPLIDLLSNVIPLPSFTKNKLEIYSMETEFAFISIRLLLFSFSFLLYKWFYGSDEKFNLYFNVFFIGIVFTTLFNEIPQFSYRIKAYFLWTDVLLWVFIIERTIKNYIVLRALAYFALIAIYMLTLVEFLDAVSERGNYIYPYKFFWE